MSSNDRVIIFDTTLRDGEQSPGASMTGEEKLRIARALERLKVDVIEAGFAIASPGDFAAVKLVADNIKDSTVCSGARRRCRHRTRCRSAGRRQLRAHPHLYRHQPDPHAVQAAHAAGPVVEQAVRAVKKARSLCADVEFSCEDAGRSEIDFLCRIIEAAIDAGARTINIPDTVGYAIPHQYADTIRQLLERIPNADKAVFSVHCHNDLGLAVANSLAAVVAGARRGMHYQRPRRACRQRRAGRDRHGDQDPPGPAQRAHPHRDRAHPRRLARSRASPAFRCSRTRPSSAPTPSPTSRASTGRRAQAS